MQNVNVNRQTDRQSNIELLRIVSMIMIVFYHFAVHGGFKWETPSMTIPYLWYNFIAMGGKIGVNIFVLISGYFLITSNSKLFNFKKILKFWGQLIFYSISILAIFLLLQAHDYGMKEVIKAAIKAVFPITFSSWWFASTYFVLYIIHPFLNIFLNALTKKSYQIFLAILVIMWSVIPTFTTLDFQSNSLCWFVTLYAIAGYARLYGFNRVYTTKKYFALCGVFSALTYLSSVIFTILGTRWSIFFDYVTYFYGMQKLSVLLISLTLFMAFVTLKMGYHKWINTLAAATFGVYLIHDNSFVSPFLWIDVFKNAQYQNSLFLIPCSIIVVALVYTVCTAIDLIRKKFLERPFMFIVNRCAEAVLKPFAKICEWFRIIVFGNAE